MPRHSFLYKENEALRKQIEALKRELELNKQNADLNAERSKRQLKALRTELVILTATFAQRSKQLREHVENVQTRALKNASQRRNHSNNNNNNNNNHSVASCKKIESFVASESFRSTRNSVTEKKDSSFLYQDVRLKNSTVKINRKTESVPATIYNNNKTDGTSCNFQQKFPSDKPLALKKNDLTKVIPSFTSQDVRCQNKTLNINRKLELTSTTPESDYKKSSLSSPAPKESLLSKATVVTYIKDVRLHDKSLKINRYVGIVPTTTSTTIDHKPSMYEQDIVSFDSKVTAYNKMELNNNADNTELTTKSVTVKNDDVTATADLFDFTADWSDVFDEKIDFSLVLNFDDDEYFR